MRIRERCGISPARTGQYGIFPVLPVRGAAGRYFGIWGVAGYLENTAAALRDEDTMCPWMVHGYRSAIPRYSLDTSVSLFWGNQEKRSCFCFQKKKLFWSFLALGFRDFDSFLGYFLKSLGFPKPKWYPARYPDTNRDIYPVNKIHRDNYLPHKQRASVQEGWSEAVLVLFLVDYTSTPSCADISTEIITVYSCA